MGRIGIPLVLIILVATPGFADESVRETAFAEVFVIFDKTSEDGLVSARVDSIFYLGDGKRQLVEKSLRVGCDVGLADWFFAFDYGMELELNWEIDTQPTRGWLIFGGNGGVVQLSLPKEGWPVDCNCDKKDDAETGTLFGAITDESGEILEKIQLTGGNELLPLRLLPFWKGQDPAPPESLRLLLSWEPLT